MFYSSVLLASSQDSFSFIGIIRFLLHILFCKFSMGYTLCEVLSTLSVQILTIDIGW